MSRTKGRRGEQELVLYLKTLGYYAERILKQYQEAGQPDVIASKNGVSITFENKYRKESYKSIYKLYYNERDGGGALRFHLNGVAVEIANDFKQTLISDKYFIDLNKKVIDPKSLRVYQRICKLRELKQSADYLVIKDNGKARLFIKYWI
jgi:hypothetical protein